MVSDIVMELRATLCEDPELDELMARAADEIERLREFQRGVCGVRYDSAGQPHPYVLSSLDSAYTEKEENDPPALAVLGVFRGKDSD